MFKKVSIIFILALISSQISFGQTAKDIWQGKFSPSLRNRTNQYITISVDGDKANISVWTQSPADNKGYRPSDIFYTYVGIVDGRVIKIPNNGSDYDQVRDKIKAGKDSFKDFNYWFVYTDIGEYYQIEKWYAGKVKYRLLEKRKEKEAPGHLTKVIDNNFDKWGFKDENGNLIIPYAYDEVNDFHNGHAAVCKDEKWGMIDSLGKTLLPCKYAKVGNYSHDLIPVSDNVDFIYEYYILPNGKIAFDCSQFSKVYDFLPEGIGLVKLQSGRYSFIDKKGRDLLDKDCEVVKCDITNGHILAKRGGKWGIVNTKGKVVVPFIYDQIKGDKGAVYGKSGYFAVELNGKWGSIDSQNNVKIPIEYQSIDIVDNDNVEFKINDMYGMMDYVGNIKISPRKEEIYVTSGSYVSPDEQYYYLKDLNNKGVIDNHGKVTVEPKYRRLSIQGKYAYVEEYGREACFLNCKDGSVYADKWGYIYAPKNLFNMIGR